ncbi:MAG: glyceraldehyde 3-phosphate dehydrogenase NAD-binding domain-containing protein [Castellaniella sp.]|uniref:type I glyceraldehyde-3-phosphate dehydrogenase n=1 Tax=Castellaniella sp. TaxID=1955812 RepID=UPI002A365E2A|nr:glyceraldehyde 3-phosphate dehydrogenase NAD-binding domain-containing protein [Castellaniella sp.]MDY0308942.1 glyceraldehyde 3-phosphate dehydrogenase NAD-binding domain-containing protein [Castellaniella sp.]
MPADRPEPVLSRPLRIAINGYGRIGRCVLRALMESPHRRHMDVVAINEPADLESMAYLTRFDSTHGVFPGEVRLIDGGLEIAGRTIPVFHARNPADGPWDRLEFDLLLECSGAFATRDRLQAFLDAGCPRVLVSHPGKSAADVDCTIVHGINDGDLRADQRIVSAASCTTNAAVPILDLLERRLGVESAFLTTLHSVMNDQPMIDGYHHADLRRTRSAMQSIVPVATGLAQGIERMLPGLAGRIQAKAVRVPILNVSAIDLAVNLRQDTSTAILNALFSEAARARPDLIACTSQPQASVDFNHDPHSVVIDLGQTRVNQHRFANLMIWFDNEWGFANRMLDVARVWAGLFQDAAVQAHAHLSSSGA